MKAKVIQDGNRVIITFTGIENPEEFVEKVVKIVSDSSENEVTPQKVLGLAPPPESYDKEDIEEVVEKEEPTATSEKNTKTASTGKPKEKAVDVPKETETVEISEEVIDTVDETVVIPTETAEMVEVTETPVEKVVSEETVETLEKENCSENPVKEVKKPVEDFEAPYTGMTPEQIFKTPKHEGFYFLCRCKVPERYKEERRKVLFDYAQSKKFFVPPYGNIIRMKGYLNMANRILDLKDIELIKMAANDKTTSEEDIRNGLETVCKQLHKELEKFFNNL